jgi:adenine phosphoribosyltransferase
MGGVSPDDLRAGAGFVPARKPGKLPSETVGVEYLLEYVLQYAS